MPLTQYAAKVDSAQRGKDWQNGTQAVKSASVSGDLPQTFGIAAEICDQAFNRLKPGDQKTLQDVSSDTRNAIYMLAASFSDQDNTNEHVQAVQHLIGQMSPAVGTTKGTSER